MDAGRTYVIENPEYEAFQGHGGTPYQIEPQHDFGPISPGDRIDRAIQDVDRAMGLIEKGDRLLQEPATADLCRESPRAGGKFTVQRGPGRGHSPE